MSQIKTPLWQRIGIWIIAIAMIFGTLIGLIFMVLATQNSNIDPSTIAQEEQIKQYKKAQEELRKQAEEERKNLEVLSGYADKVTAFDEKSVTELKVETLKEGNGATVKETDTISANYTGWRPDGKIFDSTKSKGSEAISREFALNGVIKGWTKGLSGKKVGGVYLLSIPSDQAYGASGSNDGLISPNQPLKFVVEIVSRK